MPEAILVFYMNAAAILVVGTAIAFVAINAVGAVGNGISQDQVPRVLISNTIVLALWFATIMHIAPLSILGGAPFAGGPPLLGIVILLGSFLGYLALTRFPTPRVIVDRASQRYFMGLQTLRFIGGVFLIGAITGQVPLLFAIPAGVGDLWAAYMGYRAVKAINANAPDARAKIIQANWVGILDFVIAVFTGLITADTVYKVTPADSINIVGEYPLVLIPGLFVPMFLIAHYLSIRALRAEKAQTQGAEAI